MKELHELACMSEGETLTYVQREYGDGEPLSYGFSVTEGWVRYRQCGDHPYGDDTVSFWEEFSDASDALAYYGRCVRDAPNRYRTERMTAGKCWQEKDAFVRAELVVYDDEGECLLTDVICEYRYGSNGCEREVG